jgi:hypothetical protein
MPTKEKEKEHQQKNIDRVGQNSPSKWAKPGLWRTFGDLVVSGSLSQPFNHRYDQIASVFVHDL